MTDSKIFGGIVEPQALNPQIVEIALHWNGSLEAFVTAYKNFEDALYPDKPEPLSENKEEPEEEEIDDGIDDALVERFKTEYHIGHDPVFGNGVLGIWDAIVEIEDIRESANTIRTLDEFDALIQRWRFVSKNISFLEKKNVSVVIGGLERVGEYQSSGPEKRYVAAAIALLKRLA